MGSGHPPDFEDGFKKRFEDGTEITNPLAQAKVLFNLMKKAGHPIPFADAYAEALSLSEIPTAETNPIPETAEV